MELGPLQKFWVQSLKDNSHRQMTFSLGKKVEGEEEYKACCLGELVVCHAIMNNIPLPFLQLSLDPDIHLYLHESNDGDVSTGTLGNTFDNYGLLDSVGSFFKYFTVSFNGKLYTSLAGMNDGGMTWPEIAEFVEQNPHKVFTKSV